MLPEDRRTLWVLLAATVACYATGYPLALWGHSAVGWVLVFLGGPLLLILGALTIRQLHQGAAHRTRPESPDRRPG